MEIIGKNIKNIDNKWKISYIKRDRAEKQVVFEEYTTKRKAMQRFGELALLDNK